MTGAYVLGLLSYYTGNHENPFKSDDPRHVDWLEGWSDACDENLNEVGGEAEHE